MSLRDLSDDELLEKCRDMKISECLDATHLTKSELINLIQSRKVDVESKPTWNIFNLFGGATTNSMLDHLSARDAVSWCLSSAKANRNCRNDNAYWKDRIAKEYPEYQTLDVEVGDNAFKTFKSATEQYENIENMIVKYKRTPQLVEPNVMIDEAIKKAKKGLERGEDISKQLLFLVRLKNIAERRDIYAIGISYYVKQAVRNNLQQYYPMFLSS